MSSRALSLQAYLATTRGSGSSDMPALPPRPPGRLVWAHATGAERGRALASLCARLMAQHPDASVILSGDMVAHDDMPHVAAPPERLADCVTYMRHLAPDVVLWAGGALRPALLSAARQEGAHLVALDLEPEGIETPAAARWLPDPAPATLALFHSLYSTDERAARRLRRLGMEPARVHAAQPLLDAEMPLPCDETQHEEIAGLMAGRPVWLAARLRGLEARDVLSAHRQAVRLNHRLLLVIVPATEEDADRAERAAAASQLRVCNWDAGETPDENTQVLLTEGPEQLGLWYRLAPLAFLGGSLLTGHGGEDPFEAATLGTAILYGPNVGRHLASYTRLVGAGAARIVRDADSLATAVLQLIAPDAAAQMAHAGWEVISSGAELVDEVIAEVADILDAKATV
ncbi:3-deoxy-D-manno-octulosonic acid transferase [Sagittula salina]|uniref:3-deoxy-D-manno-octulosonic acid transferase n=1 Tax=Sagittula salina TaxID=2820268 RepID=A0A940ML45_9RHOB|nr:glycosyltransferase N-terminal domain-containing protein [Sagittula salina]MBP0481588.1 3-deoxy-D-manno-octulosonic acid transferase [Sagittula salina]